MIVLGNLTLTGKVRYEAPGGGVLGVGDGVPSRNPEAGHFVCSATRRNQSNLLVPAPGMNVHVCLLAWLR